MDLVRLITLILLVAGSIVIGYQSVLLGFGIFFCFLIPFHIWDQKSQKELELYIFIWTVIKREIGRRVKWTR